MRPEVQPWFRQAEADLQAAEDSLNNSHFEWACFQAQQAAEKALKAFLWENAGLPPARTHSLYDPGDGLLNECQRVEPAFSAVAREADLLNQQQQRSRYPHTDTSVGHAAPADYYSRQEAMDCILAARSVLDLVRRYLSL